jgi:hypothetical protein
MTSAPQATYGQWWTARRLGILSQVEGRPMAKLRPSRRQKAVHPARWLGPL